ncbi:MAG: carboxypeptidase-like regulatory domain-containing protein, partial [Anaerolineaceae bacterium]
IILFLVLSACASGLSLSNTSMKVDPTQVEMAKERLVAKLATDAALTRQVEISTPVPVITSMGVGSIIGTLSYPSEFIPALMVVAYRQGTTEYYAITTVIGQGVYQINNIPPGTYHVVAYYVNMAAGFSQAVPCGLRVDCNDHSLIDVIVNSDHPATNINPNDWYASPGSFPPKP